MSDDSILAAGFQSQAISIYLWLSIRLTGYQSLAINLSLFCGPGVVGAVGAATAYGILHFLCIRP